MSMKDDVYYEYLYNHFSGMVYSTAYQILKNSSLAQDVLQETFYSFFRYNKNLKNRNEKTIYKWLKITARNKAIDIIKELNQDLEFKDEIFSIKDNPESALINKELALELKNGIDQLDRKYSSILQMRYYDELSVKEIAEMQNLSIFTVYTRLHRGLKKLKEIYERWDRK